jgi:hypothetical protein
MKPANVKLKIQFEERDRKKVPRNIRESIMMAHAGYIKFLIKIEKNMELEKIYT